MKRKCRIVTAAPSIFIYTYNLVSRFFVSFISKFESVVIDLVSLQIPGTLIKRGKRKRGMCDHTIKEKERKKERERIGG